MTPSVASQDPWPNASAETEGAPGPAVGAPVTSGGRDQQRTVLGLLDDAALLLLIALLFPVLVLVIGLPVALLARLAMAIAQRL